MVYVFGNREALLTLAKICIKLAIGPYKQGYHIHIPEDFDADQPAPLCLGVEPEK
jgi:hypothetical protein